MLTQGCFMEEMCRDRLPYRVETSLIGRSVRPRGHQEKKKNQIIKRVWHQREFAVVCGVMVNNCNSERDHWVKWLPADTTSKVVKGHQGHWLCFSTIDGGTCDTSLSRSSNAARTLNRWPLAWGHTISQGNFYMSPWRLFTAHHSPLLMGTWPVMSCVQLWAGCKHSAPGSCWSLETSAERENREGIW